ncbi:DUF4232 domain-containing protein [Amycolatopsis dongchuanensis]|uniref:DUF4232 domain-containing protein n=1 Tax=Amycolatopsis dongchuanensis TaxID=1070866 RepID=A0ABP9PY32_9PSEU
MRALPAVLLLALLASCGKAAHPDNGIEPPLLTVGPSTPVDTPGPRCPDSGLSVTAGEVDAALGHRASVLTATNCGTTPVRLDGYPAIRLLDATRAPLAVTVAHDSSYMAIDPGPAPLTVAPGGRALTVLSWSNTVTYGDSATGAFVEVVPLPGAAAQTLPLDTDLGTTGSLTVTAWASSLRS